MYVSPSCVRQVRTLVPVHRSFARSLPDMMVRELPTPFLTVDLNAVDRNIARMQRFCDAHGLALRPHLKTHKMPQIAERQRAAGAKGITCQKLGEAEVIADAGFNDILITFPLIGIGKPERAARLAKRTRLIVGADSASVARALSAAALEVGSSIGFLVDCDTGFGRTGVQTPKDAADLADLVHRLPGLEFIGLMTHPALVESGPWLIEAREQIEGRRLNVSCVSGGGTMHAPHVPQSGVFTELRVGTYVYGDRRCAADGIVPLKDCALRVVSTIVSRPTPDRAILDAGSKTLSSDCLPSPGDQPGYGLVIEHPNALLRELSEEHGILDLSRCEPKPDIGDVVTIVPNHACGAVNLHDSVALHHGGNDVDIAAIPARGRVR